MSRASRGRLGRIALSIVGLLVLLFAGVVGARVEAHEGPAGVSIVADAHCAGCASGAHEHDHGQDPRHERHAGCAVTCVSVAIPAVAPAVPTTDRGCVAWPSAAGPIAGRSTLPEPEPPRPSARA